MWRGNFNSWLLSFWTIEVMYSYFWLRMIFNTFLCQYVGIIFFLFYNGLYKVIARKLCLILHMITSLDFVYASSYLSSTGGRSPRKIKLCMHKHGDFRECRDGRHARWKILACGLTNVIVPSAYGLSKASPSYSNCLKLSLELQSWEEQESEPISRHRVSSL